MRKKALFSKKNLKRSLEIQKSIIFNKETKNNLFQTQIIKIISLEITIKKSTVKFFSKNPETNLYVCMYRASASACGPQIKYKFSWDASIEFNG